MNYIINSIQFEGKPNQVIVCLKKLRSSQSKALSKSTFTTKIPYSLFEVVLDWTIY